jgi:hypothetical protein
MGQKKGVVMRTSVKTIGSFSVLAMTVALVTAPGAFAQSGRNAAGSNVPANSTLGTGVMQAPVGHLQPRRDPSVGDQPYQATAEEKALDRKIKSICRGC